MDLEAASKRYAYYMHEVRSRLNLIARAGASVEAKKPITGFAATDVELCFLNFRKILEIMMFASILAHKDAEIELSSQICDRAWNARKIFDYLESKNSDFYPVAIETVDHNSVPPSLVARPNGFLTKAQFLELYDVHCGKMLHATREVVIHKPYVAPIAEIRHWWEKIWKLLQHHWIHLSDDLCFAVILTLKNSESIQVAPMGRIEANFEKKQA